MTVKFRITGKTIFFHYFIKLILGMSYRRIPVPIFMQKFGKMPGGEIKSSTYRQPKKNIKP